MANLLRHTHGSQFLKEFLHNSMVLPNNFLLRQSCKWANLSAHCQAGKFEGGVPSSNQEIQLGQGHRDIYMHKMGRFEILSLSTRKLPSLLKSKLILLAFFEMISRWHCCWWKKIVFRALLTLFNWAVFEWNKSTDLHLHKPSCRSKLVKASRGPAPWCQWFCCSEISGLTWFNFLGTVKKWEKFIYFHSFDTRIYFACVCCMFLIFVFSFFSKTVYSFENCAWTTSAVWGKGCDITPTEETNRLVKDRLWCISGSFALDGGDWNDLKDICVWCMM